MKDNLEEFIKTHRGEFDDLEPRQETWSKIRSQLNDKKKRDYTWVWKAAAAIFLCLSIGLAIERNMKKEALDVVAFEEAPKDQSTELREVETYYTQLITLKRNEIKQVIEENKLTDVELLEDLDQLDSMYAELKNDLDKNQNDQRLINAMIRNLQLRVEILNRQLKILERISKYEEDEKISV